MSATWSEMQTVFGEELRRATRRLAYRISTLAVPVLLLVLLIAVPLVRDITSGDENGEVRNAQIGLLDLSGDVATEDSIEEGLRIFLDRERGVTALVADEIKAFFVISQDYVNNGRVEWLHTGSVISADVSGQDYSERFQSWLRKALIADALPDEVKTRFSRPAEFESTVVSEGGSTKEGVKEVDSFSISYIFAIMLGLAVATGSGYLLQSVSDEKENRMIEILLTSVSPLGVMAGKVLALGSAGLLQVIVWAASIAFLGPRILESFPDLDQWSVEPIFLFWVVSFFLAGYFVIGVIMAGIGGATTSYREGSAISLIVMLPAVGLPLWLNMAIAGNPDEGIARVLSFVPLTAPVTMILRLGATEVSLVEIVGSLAVTILGGIGLLWASARVFRAGLLMYGQRMSLRRVLSTLRHAG